MKDRREIVKERFDDDIENHSMEVLRDDGMYRHLKFTNEGSQCYRFDIHTMPGFLMICQDMGTYVFSRLPDMFEFFRMDDGDFNKKHVINPGYWAEKLQAVDAGSARGLDGNGYETFSEDQFREHVKDQYDQFAEEYLDSDEEEVTEAFAEDTETHKQKLEDLWEAIEEEVLSQAEGHVRAYDAAMEFRWKSDDGEMEFDMSDFWEFHCTEYTHHYLWILFAIVWGIGEYDKSKVPNTDLYIPQMTATAESD